MTAPPTAFGQLTGLLASAVVATAFLIVWRQSVPGRLALFAVQSALLAALAGAIAAFTGKHELLVVALAVLAVKVWAIPRILRRVAPAVPRSPTAARSRVGPLLAAGILVFENGVFMLALLATYGLPALVEAGVFLDVLVAVLVAKVVLGEIRESIQSTDIDRLRELRG